MASGGKIRCTKCGADNREGARFCSECATPFAAKCPQCGAANKPGAKFCDECGASLASPSTIHQSAQPVRAASEPADASALEGERKTVTALFADIKGSMDLMEGIDPEEARAIVDPALKLMIDAAHRYDGYVVQSTGDGIFAIFGAPVAHEDHPQRALYAALRMQEDLKRYADKLREVGQPPLSVRVGVNAGEVVVRSIQTGDAQTEYTPIGHSISLASRLQTLAAPGSVVIGESVQKFVEGYFQLKALGPSRIKGISETVNIFEVTGLGPLRTRLQRSAGRGYTKFVGREREMDTLKHAAEQAKAGHGQIVAAMAEPGVGKSRLFFEFKAISQSGWMVLEAFSVSHGKASSYVPVIDLLRSYFEISSEDDARKRRERVNGKVLTLDRALEDTIPYLFALLGIVESDDPLAQLDAQVRKRRTLDAIKRILLRESLNGPLMVMFEDLHWIDDETQALLNLLADSIGTAKLLLLVNYRPQYSHQWGSKTYYTQLRLDPLGNESAEHMLSSLVGDAKDLVPLKRMIIEKTEGNPFFMEEMVQVLLDEGALVRNGTMRLTRSLSQLKIPATVQAILASRIDRLPPEEKDLLQALAVVGREFSLSLVREIIKASPDELDRMMNDLQLAEFIYEQPAVGDIEYTFKHALTQEVVYNSILIERRKLIHARTGAAIETAFAGRLEDQIEKLVYHYSRSGDARKTLHYMSLAAEQALRRSDYSDARRRVEAGIEALKTIGEGNERDELELALQIVRADAIDKSSARAADPAALEAYSRARSLCTRVGTTSQTIRVLWGLQRFYQVKAEPRTAREFAQEMVTVVERGRDPQQVMAVRSRLGHALSFLGEFAKARPLFEEAAIHLAPNSRLFGEDKTYALIMLARVLWFLGFPTQAARRNEEAIARSRTGVLMIYNLVMPASISILLGNSTRAIQLAKELEDFASEHEAPYFRDHAQKLQGAALIQAGQIEKGLALIDPYLGTAGLKGSRASEYWHFLVPAVHAYGRCGRTRYALQLIDDALSDSAASGQSMFDAEYQRAKGELLLTGSTPDAAAAEANLRQAIETARAQSAKMPELRATTSLARLLAKQGKGDDARAMLAEIYNWFTEGFDTADLKDAKALLEELRP